MYKGRAAVAWRCACTATATIGTEIIERFSVYLIVGSGTLLIEIDYVRESIVCAFILIESRFDESSVRFIRYLQGG